MSGELDDDAFRAMLDRISADRATMKPGEYPEEQPMPGAASPSPSMEMGVVAWRVPDEWSPTGYVFATESLIDGSVPLVTLSSAQSALAAMATQVDMLNSTVDRCRKDASAAEAQVQRLTEENEALRKERTSLIETKREQIERLEGELDLVGGQMRYISKSNIANFDRAEAAEARIKALEEALRPFAAYAWALRGRQASEHELGWMGTNEAGEPAEVSLTVATFRRARSALKENTL